MRFVLAASPQELPQLRSFRHTLALVAYAVSESGDLTRSDALRADMRGGLMGLMFHTQRFPHPDGLCRAILQECRIRGFEGVLADFEGPRTPQSVFFFDTLGAALMREGRRLFVPLPHTVPSAQILVGTAVSGGTLEGHLGACIERFGAKRLALDCQRLLMDFALPCRHGEGAPLTLQEIEALRRRVGSPTFFSKELCCNYFSYCENGRAHFVAFDTADTLHKKLALAEHLGIGTAFFMLPEIRDVMQELF